MKQQVLSIDLAKPKSGGLYYTLVWLEPATQSKASTWSVVNL